MFMKITRPYTYALAGAAATFLLGLLTGIGLLTTFGLIGLFAAGGMLFANQFDKKNTTDAPPFSRDAPPTQAGLELEGGRETWIRGVSNYQNEIRKVGSGPHTFLFMAEPNNKFDSLAVMVCAQVGNRQIKVGYLPAGTETTIAIHQYARHLEKSGQYISGPGVIENGEVGLVVGVQTPAWTGLRKELMKLEQQAAISNGTFRSITTSAPQANMPTEFFRQMDVVNVQEFSENFGPFRTEIGKHVVWFTLNKINDDLVNVHLSFPGDFPGPQVGRIAKKHMQYALAYTSNGPICGRGVWDVGFNGFVSFQLRDPDWK
jgi:hypothetical protein